MERLRVLVVDDEPGMRAGVQRTLRSFSVTIPDVEGEVAFDVEEAATGEAALERIAASPLDLVLLDHKLPGISGLDLLARVAEYATDTLIVMITAYASLETAISATKRGAYDFLAKPFTPEELRGTVRKAARQLLLQRQARRLAEEKRRVRFQFISVLSHELKAPLAAVEGYLHILRDKSAGDSLQAYERAVERSLIRIQGMRKLIFDLLDLTRIESGQKQRQFADVDLREIARAAVEAVAAEARERDIRVSLHGDRPVVLHADASELEIILNNLVTNAVKYNRDGGSVDIRLEQQADQATIAVSDTGIGLTPAETEKLFADFVRIKNAKTRHILGSGLGLSTVKKLVDLYGGSVRVESTPDTGSTFTVVLPR